MSNVLIYDKLTGYAKTYLQSVNTSYYEGRDDCVMNPDPALMNSVKTEYIKVQGGTPAEMTAQEKQAIDEAKPPSPIPYEVTLADHETRIGKLETAKDNPVEPS